MTKTPAPSPEEMTAAQKMLEEMKRPPLRFEFPAELDRAPLKMTYGLEMDLRRMLPDPQTAVQLLLADPYTQDYVIRRCLTEKNQLITDPEKDLISLDEVAALGIDGDTTEQLLMWAAEHAIYFFAKRTAGLATLGVQFQNLLTPQPQPSSTGSEDSASTTPSVGDSTA